MNARLNSSIRTTLRDTLNSSSNALKNPRKRSREVDSYTTKLEARRPYKVRRLDPEITYIFSDSMDVDSDSMSIDYPSDESWDYDMDEVYETSLEDPMDLSE